jgi:hypothetical protein
MSSYSMPPDLKFEDIINGILAFSKSLRSKKKNKLKFYLLMDII